ncbi:hypothetical protein E2562_016807 [Oryza meyeriana var. granulata]|uniref:MATH domain-containing protein n=1 Tax=Oryza meyeriana var. granulata TaxID=110450 RepID=A0A6G1BWX9_9ORYZ|nr:hypothetical protein E2562_016807 [Oryza meyeriana var. granulata]
MEYRGASLWETSETCHTITYSLLHGMEAGKYVTSSIFSVGGYNWYVRFYPDGWSANCAGSASVSLHCHNPSKDVTTRFMVLAKKDKIYGTSPVDTIFSPAHPAWGFDEFVPKFELKSALKSSSSHLNLMIKCVLTVRQESHSGGKSAELYSAMKEKTTQCIKIDDIEPPIFDALLHYMYTDSMLDDFKGDMAKLQHLLVAADRYGIERLRMMCEEKLSVIMDSETVANTFALAEQHNCTHLRQACIGFMASRQALGAVMETDEFKDLVSSSPLVMKDILDQISRDWSKVDGQ